TRLFVAASERRRVARIHFCECGRSRSPHLNPLPTGEAEAGRIRFIGRLVRTAGRKIFALEFVVPALSETNRVRCASQLEVDLSKLFGVLSLPGSTSGAFENLAA